jgi:hypothetical protein
MFLASIIAGRQQVRGLPPALTINPKQEFGPMATLKDTTPRRPDDNVVVILDRLGRPIPPRRPTSRDVVLAAAFAGYLAGVTVGVIIVLVMGRLG